MDFVGAIKAGFTNYANFRGVASRSEFWYWYLFLVLAGVVLSAIDQFSNLMVLQSAFSAITFIPYLAVQVRRLRDAGHTWKWLLLEIPLLAVFSVGIIGLVVRAIALVPDFQALVENQDPSLLQNQIDILAADQSFVSFALLLLLSILLLLAFVIFMIVLLVKPTKTFEQGNKYLTAPTPEN